MSSELRKFEIMLKNSKCSQDEKINLKIALEACLEESNRNLTARVFLPKVRGLEDDLLDLQFEYRERVAELKKARTELANIKSAFKEDKKDKKLNKELQNEQN